ncbi:hypothetical protein GQ53DRAFT_432071 [Thozetella sp. PMI_491]|nr:hypothetical protein GQ53DRAFT_432071 [Thozetella sp. PMI_491]
MPKYCDLRGGAQQQRTLGERRGKTGQASSVQFSWLALDARSGSCGTVGVEKQPPSTLHCSPQCFKAIDQSTRPSSVCHEVGSRACPARTRNELRAGQRNASQQGGAAGANSMPAHAALWWLVSAAWLVSQAVTARRLLGVYSMPAREEPPSPLSFIAQRRRRSANAKRVVLFFKAEGFLCASVLFPPLRARERNSEAPVVGEGD